ncbi:MAG TPA: RNA polymerase sigma factor [Myxococcota bacterium]|nr:RNA polymerase sigma factor [Myxococcota bacterium]
MADESIDDELLDAACESWNRYLTALDGFRPALFRYCRSLTGNVWDAEDLVQETLEKGFARLGSVTYGVDNPRGYVLRIASNLWLSQLRRRRVAESARGLLEELGPDAPGPSPEDAAGVRDAGAALLQLAPQERAAILLKETFDMTLEEIAQVLATSVGAVKAALHRGRARLRETHASSAPRRTPARAVLDRFVERYNARDREGLLDLLLDTASIEMPGVDFEAGRDTFARKHGWLTHNLVSPFDGKPTDAIWETVDYEGEPIVLVLYPRGGELRVGSLMRFETDADRISHVRVYATCPDAVREVADRLGRPSALLGFYHFPASMHAAINARARAGE